MVGGRCSCNSTRSHAHNDNAGRRRSARPYRLVSVASQVQHTNATGERDGKAPRTRSFIAVCRSDQLCVRQPNDAGSRLAPLPLPSPCPFRSAPRAQPCQRDPSKNCGQLPPMVTALPFNLLVRVPPHHRVRPPDDKQPPPTPVVNNHARDQHHAHPASGRLPAARVLHARPRRPRPR